MYPALFLPESAQLLLFFSCTHSPSNSIFSWFSSSVLLPSLFPLSHKLSRTYFTWRNGFLPIHSKGAQHLSFLPFLQEVIGGLWDISSLSAMVARWWLKAGLYTGSTLWYKQQVWAIEGSIHDRYEIFGAQSAAMIYWCITPTTRYNPARSSAKHVLHKRQAGNQCLVSSWTNQDSKSGKQNICRKANMQSGRVGIRPPISYQRLPCRVLFIVWHAVQLTRL